MINRGVGIVGDGTLGSTEGLGEAHPGAFGIPYPVCFGTLVSAGVSRSRCRRHGVIWVWVPWSVIRSIVADGHGLVGLGLISRSVEAQASLDSR